MRKLDERRTAEDSYCSFEALEVGFAALQSYRDGAEVGWQYGVHGGAQKRLWAKDHRLHRLPAAQTERRVMGNQKAPVRQSSVAARLDGDNLHPPQVVPVNFFCSRGASP